MLTKGFYTIVNFPYEGCLITEHPTKADALKAHQDNLKNVGSDDPNAYLLGAALVSIEVVDEKGEWCEKSR